MLPDDVKKHLKVTPSPELVAALPQSEETVKAVLSVGVSRGTVDWEAHLEALPMATWIGDPTGGNVFVNRAYRRLLGVYDLDDVADRGWEKHVHPDDRETYVRQWNLFVDGVAARFKETIRWIRPDTGQTVLLSVRAQKLVCGQFQGWIREANMEQALEKLETISRGA